MPQSGIGEVRPHVVCRCPCMRTSGIREPAVGGPAAEKVGFPQTGSAVATGTSSLSGVPVLFGIEVREKARSTSALSDSTVAD